MWQRQSETIFRLIHVEWKQSPERTPDFLAFYEIFVKHAALSVMLLRHFDYIIQPPCRLAAFGRLEGRCLSYGLCLSSELGKYRVIHFEPWSKRSWMMQIQFLLYSLVAPDAINC